MKLATLKDGSRDGQLIVVSRDLKFAVIANNIAPTLQDLLDSWDFMAPQCEDLYFQLNHGRAPNSFDFDPQQCMAPLPRAYQFADASAYVDYIELIGKTRNRDLPDLFRSSPLMHQAASDDFIGACDDIVVVDDGFEVDFESEVAVITGDINMGSAPARAGEFIRLIMLANDVSLRALIPDEMIKGFGFLQSKPATSFSPVAVTPDELGDAWQGGKVHLSLRSSLNGRVVGHPNAGMDMTFSFPQLISHLTRTRNVRAGTIVGSGAVFNRDGNKGCSSLYGIRALELLSGSETATPFLRGGDHIKIEMMDKNGKSVFGAIDQKVTKLT